MSTAVQFEADRDALPVCLWKENPNRLVSLWDLVNRFNVFGFATLCGLLESVMASAEASSLNVASTEAAGKICRDVETFCKMCGFDVCEDMAGIAANHLARKPMQVPMAIQSEVRAVQTALVREAHERKFLVVAKNKSDFVDNDALFGSAVQDKFPSASLDIRASGNCLAAECHTAAVFHLMRSVEWGLRALGSDVGIKRLRSRAKKTAKVKYTPLAWGEWDTILNQIRSAIETRLTRINRGQKKQDYQEFYNPMLDNIERFKDAYRNHVMHTRREYTPGEALEVFEQVRYFMKRLASRPAEC
jgi:hypothetical protein